MITTNALPAAPAADSYGGAVAPVIIAAAEPLSQYQPQGEVIIQDNSVPSYDEYDEYDPNDVPADQVTQ